MKKQWITTKELAKIKNISERAVRKSIATRKYVTRKCGKSYEILVTSLEENVIEKITEVEEKIVPFDTTYKNVPEEQKKLALAKFDLIKRWEEYKVDKKSKTKAGKDFLELYNRELLHKELHDKIGNVAIGTIYQWQKQLKNYDNDWHCLIKNYSFGKKSQKTALKKHEEEIFLKILLHPNKINIGKAIKLTKNFLAQRGQTEFCCDLTFRRFAENYKRNNYDTWVFAREGSKALKDKVVPYISRDISVLEVGDVLIGDGHKLAFQVVNPYTGHPTRATMVAYQDWKSTALVGFEIMLEENTQCIASALRNAIINLGKIPKYCYQDNGKAFRAKYFIENGLSGLFANLGIQPIFAKPYNAKAKPIERFFREFQDSFEVLLPTFVGSSIENKPACLKRNEKFHKSIHSDAIYTIEQVFACINNWLEFHYSQPCPNISGKTIGEVLNEGKGSGVNVSTLDDMMMSREIKTVYRNGIKFLNADYYDDALYGFREAVVIKYSLFDLSQIKVFTKSGEFLCNAKRFEKINPLANYIGSPKDMEDLKQRTKMQKKLEQATERKYIQHLKREKAYHPLETLDLEDKQELNEMKKICLQEKSEEIAPTKKNPNIFASRYERYEYLIKKQNLTKEEAAWIDDYKNSDEFQQIYEQSEVCNL